MKKTVRNTKPAHEKTVRKTQHMKNGKKNTTNR